MDSKTTDDEAGLQSGISSQSCNNLELELADTRRTVDFTHVYPSEGEFQTSALAVRNGGSTGTANLAVTPSLSTPTDDVSKTTQESTTGAKNNNADDGIVDFESQIDSELYQEEHMSMDEMKIQTMYKMVDDCTVSIHGKEVAKKVLYLTNKQASLFDEQAMDRCIQALDLGEPKFIICLLPSVGVRSQMAQAHPQYKHKPESEYSTSVFTTSEISPGDERVTETQILLYLKSCVLPLAKQTRALIVVGGANDCYLSSALASVVLNEQARLGKDCPFTVVATVSEYEIHYKATTASERGSVAAQVAKRSHAWRRRMHSIHQFDSDTSAMQQCDLTAAASRYIIFESIDEGRDGTIMTGKYNTSPAKNFTSVFLHAMTRRLPSIAIQAFGIDTGIPHLVDLAARNIPVLLLDSTERAITLTTRDKGITQLSSESDSFPCIPLERVKKMKIVNHSLTLEGRFEILQIAEEMIEQKWKAHIKHGVGDEFESSLLAFLHSALKLGTQLMRPSDHMIPLYQRINDLEDLQHANKDDQKQSIIPEVLASEAVNFIQTRNSAFSKYAQLARVKMWLQKHDSALDDLVPEAEELLKDVQQECDDITASGGTLFQTSIKSSVWLSYFDILSSPNTFSASIYDIDELKRIMGSVAKIDRLPESNSFEALLAIQNAWDLVELYNNVADVYKVVTNICYIVLIMVSILVILCTVLEIRITGFSSRLPIIILGFISTATVAFVSFTNPAVRWQQLRIAALSIESNIWVFRTRSGPYRTSGEGFDAAADTLFIETLKDIKQSIHDSADLKSTGFFGKSLQLGKYGQHESNSFSKGIYTRNKAKDETVIPFELGTLVQSKMHEHELGEPSMTDIYRDTPDIENGVGVSSTHDSDIPLTLLVRYLCTGRSDTKRNKIDEDSRYEPVKPDFYIRHRLQSALQFYKSRIPKYNLIRNIIQSLLVLGSIAIAALPFFGETNLASLVSIFSSGIAAYLEFHSTNSKINRYSSIIHDLDAEIQWWKTIPQIDKSVVSNIDKLVVTCEDLMQRERQAWQSTSQAVKKLQQQNQDHHSIDVSSN